MASDVTEQKKPRGSRGSYKRSISPRTLLALEALAEGAVETLSDAARVAGLTPRAMHYAVKKPNIREWLRDHVQSTFAAGQLAASRTMLGLLKSDNSMSAYRAAAWICGVNGIAPVDTRGPLVNINVGSDAAGFVIDLSENDPRPNVVRFPTGPVLDGECVDVTPVASEQDDDGAS
jgi:hypothetical protein